MRMYIVLEYSDEFGEDWPLAENQISTLNRNHRSFVDLLELSDLLGRLYSSKVINRWQMESISSKPTSHEKNNALLGILRRRSLRDYRQAIACLHDSEQIHIATVLVCGGGMTKVHRRINLIFCIYKSERLTLRNHRLVKLQLISHPTLGCLTLLTLFIEK